MSAGDGGQGAVVNANAKGAAGGALDTVTARLLTSTYSRVMDLSGKSGGNGGALSKLTLNQQDSVLLKTANLAAGKGGDGSNGNGGNGGNTATVNVTNSDLSGFSINAGIGSEWRQGHERQGWERRHRDQLRPHRIGHPLWLQRAVPRARWHRRRWQQWRRQGRAVSKGNFFGQDLAIAVTGGERR